MLFPQHSSSVSLEESLESDYDLSFAKDIAFFSGKARNRTAIFNDALSSEPSEVFNSYYKRSVNPCGQELSAD